MTQRDDAKQTERDNTTDLRPGVGPDDSNLGYGQDDGYGMDLEDDLGQTRSTDTASGTLGEREGGNPLEDDEDDSSETENA
jgi:hypothetical protein